MAITKQLFNAITLIEAAINAHSENDKNQREYMKRNPTTDKILSLLNPREGFNTFEKQRQIWVQLKNQNQCLHVDERSLDEIILSSLNLDVFRLNMDWISQVSHF